MTTSQRQQLGQLIRQARVLKGKTQAEIADPIGIHQSQVSQLESGGFDAVSRPKLDALVALLGLDPAMFSSAKKGTEPLLKACSGHLCPSHLVLKVGGQWHEAIRPQVIDAKRIACEICGEVLMKACPHCAEELVAGSFCPYCAAPYFEAVTEAECESARALSPLELAEFDRRFVSWLSSGPSTL